MTQAELGGGEGGLVHAVAQHGELGGERRHAAARSHSAAIQRVGVADRQRVLFQLVEAGQVEVGQGQTTSHSRNDAASWRSDPLHLHSMSMRGKSFQVVDVGRQHRAARLGQCDADRVDG